MRRDDEYEIDDDDDEPRDRRPGRRRRPDRTALWVVVAIGSVLAISTVVVVAGGVARKFLDKSQSGTPPGTTWTRDDLRAAVVGKSEKEVLALLGRPESTQDTRMAAYWYYSRISYDPIARKVDYRVQIVFGGPLNTPGVVAAVNFH
jgi:hypothetical protein